MTAEPLISQKYMEVHLWKLYETLQIYQKHLALRLWQSHDIRQRVVCPSFLREMPECQYEETYSQEEYILKLVLMQSKELYRLQKVTVLRNMTQWFYWQMFGSKSGRFPTLAQLLLTVLAAEAVYMSHYSVRSYVNDEISMFLQDMLDA